MPCCFYEFPWELIGIYLAYTVVQYSRFYHLEHLMLLGRVMSGKGGDTISATRQEVLKDEFPALYNKVEIMLPDENTLRSRFFSRL